MKTRVLSMILCVMSLLNVALVTEADAYEWFTFNGHEYSLTSQWQSWDENQAEAVTQEGYLAVINSIEENEWLTHIFADTYQQDGEWNHGDPGWKSLVDIGYYQASDGNWKWINGEAGVDNPSQFYYPLGWGYPIPGTKAYLHVEGHYIPGTWNTAVYITNPDSGWGYEPAFGVIERVPEPTTIALLGLGGAAMMRRRKAV